MRLAPGASKARSWPLRQVRLENLRYVVENDDGVLHIASERQSRLAMPKGPGTA